MKLYFSKGACSLAPRIIIHELALACVFESVDLASKKTQSGENFYTINPKGYVPALVTNDGDVLTENLVILQYLAEVNHAITLLPIEKNMQRYRVLEWLDFITTELHKKFGTLFNPNIPKEINEKFFRPQLEARFDLIGQHLEHNEYLAAGHFTLPDAYLFVVLRWAHHFNLEIKNKTALARYFNMLKTRKAVQQSLDEEGLKA